MTDKFKESFNSIRGGLAVVFAACFMLFIYAPFELYITNQADFWFTARQMLPMALLLFAAALLAGALILLLARRLGERVYLWVCALAFLAFLCCYVQGNLLVSGLPGLDGSRIDWSAYPAERLKSALLWAVAAAAVALGLKKLGAARFLKISALVSLAVTLMLALTLCTLFLTTKQSDKEFALAATDKDLLTMSEDRNVIVLVLDAVDGDEFESILQSDSGYQEVFSDFIFYDNTMGGYPYSKCSVPFLLTGQWYEAKQDFDDYMADSLDNSELFRTLEDEDYRIGLYCEDDFILPEGRFGGRIDNMLTDTPAVSSNAFMCKLLVKMTAIKYAPWDLKRLGYDLLGRLPECRVYKGEGDYAYFDWSNRKFFNRFKARSPITLTDDRCFKFIHLEGGHIPHHYDKDMNIDPNGSYQSSIEGCITLCSRFFDALRESGVYDSSAIVVLSDHGYADSNGLNSVQQHPILLVKGVGESHAFQTSAAPISYADMQQALLRLMDGRGGDEVFDWAEGDSRVRRFLMYDWTNTSHLEEFTQAGKAGDTETLLPTGKVYDYAG